MTEDLYKATLFGIDIDCIDARGTSDQTASAVVRHRYPDTNGAKLQHMGQNERVVQFMVVFTSDDYERHFDLLDAIAETKTGELVHPVYGAMTGAVESVHVRNDEREQYVEIDISFVEDLLGQETTLPASDLSVEQAFADGQAAAMAKLSTDVTTELGAEGAGIIDRTLDASQGILAQFSDLTGAARSFVAQIDAGVRTLEGTLSAIAQPANSLIAVIDYGTSLPGRVIGAIAATVERYAEAYQGIRSAPARFSSSLRFGLLQLETAFSDFQSTAPAGSSRAVEEAAAMAMLADYVNIAAAQRLSLEAGYAFKTDQQNRAQARRNEAQTSFDMTGNYQATVATDPIMTATEVEAVLADCMAAAQRAIDAVRGMTGIKAATAALVAHSRKIKLETDRIIEVNIDGTLPLHLICLKYGLPYSAAERILAINPQIKNPTFVSGTIKIYAT